MEDGTNAWAPTTHQGDSDKTPAPQLLGLLGSESTDEDSLSLPGMLEPRIMIAG